jgi:hypothetical protein
VSTQGVTITVNAETAEAAERLQRFFEGAVEGFEHISKASEFFEELAGKFIAAFSIGAIVEFTREAINTAETIGTLSRQVGFSITTLAALKSQANANNIQFEELRMGLTHFNDVLNQAREHGGDAMQMFRNLSQDIALAVAAGRPAEQVYGMIAERFKQMPDGIQKSATAQLLFGRASAQWVTLLNEGAEGMEKIKELNGGITPEAVAQATEFNRSLRELHEQLEIIFLNVATQILPTLQQAVNMLKKFSEETDSAGKATAGLVDVFKGITTVVVIVGEVFIDVGKMIGYSAEGWVEAYKTALTIIQEIAGQIKTIYQDLVYLISDTVDMLLAAQKAAMLAALGQFDAARSLMKKEVSGMKDDADDLTKHLKLAFGGVPAAIMQLASTARTLNLGLINDVLSRWTNVAAFITSLWTKAPQTKPGAGNGTPAAPSAVGPAVTTDPAKLAQQQMQLDRERILLNQKIIETDPTLTQEERMKQLLPLQRQEMEILSNQVVNQKAIANDPSRTDEERVTANREIVKLQMEQLTLSRQMVTAAHPWATAFATVVQHLKEMNNLAKEAAQAFENITNTAIQSISDGITGLIEGTKTWAQALRDVGSAILHEIISAIVTMAVRWLITSIMMAAFGEALIASTSALYAAAWAGPAILATIASYGAAAEAAPPEVMGALAFAPAVSAIAAREHGGGIKAGNPYMMGERGRELVFPERDGWVFNATDSARLMDFVRSPGAGGGSGSPRVNLTVHFNDDPNRTERDVRENPKIHHVIVDVAKRSAHVIAPRT